MKDKIEILCNFAEDLGLTTMEAGSLYWGNAWFFNKLAHEEVCK